MSRPAYTLSPELRDTLLRATEEFVTEYMASYDPSHDIAHINRVVALSQRLLLASPHPLDPFITHLSALLHDVGDSKYTGEGASLTPVADFLLKNSAPSSLAVSVQTIVDHVSFSHEIKNLQKVQDVLKVYPELGVVQDADRLDALGAVGVARCFAFGAAKKPERGLQGCVDHFEEKLLKLEGMLKTEEGKRLGRERARRIKEFEGWWKEEVEGVTEAGRKWEVEDTYAGWENI